MTSLSKLGLAACIGAAAFAGSLFAATADAPWHDPRLFEAMLKIPYATNAVPVRELISPGP